MLRDGVCDRSHIAYQMQAMLTPTQADAGVPLMVALLQPLDELQRSRANFLLQPFYTKARTDVRGAK